MEFEPKVFRKLIFVRHGQYTSEPERLTALGRRQARLVAKELMLRAPTRIRCSTMPRAVETADIVSEQLRLKCLPNDLFREALLPGTVEFHRKKIKGLSRQEKTEFYRRLAAAKQSADRAYRELFKIPKRGRTVEVVVAHGNVIRYWVCRALGIPTEKWLSMDIGHGSITSIQIAGSGNVMLLGFSESCHLPLRMRTYV